MYTNRPYTWWARPLLYARVWYDLSWDRWYQWALDELSTNLWKTWRP